MVDSHGKTGLRGVVDMVVDEVVCVAALSEKGRVGGKLGEEDNTGRQKEEGKDDSGKKMGNEIVRTGKQSVRAYFFLRCFGD